MIKAIFVRSIMFISSYFPLYVLLLISQGNKIMQAPNRYLWSFIATLSILIVISFLSVLLLKNVPISNYCKPVNVKRQMTR